MTEQSPKRRHIIIFAVAISIILYLAGVFSGLYANKLIKESTQRDIFNLKTETSKDLELLQNYIDFLDSNLKDMQLEQTFVETLSNEEMCSFSAISLNELFGQLSYYWSKLPYRIEEYEKYNQLSEEYKTLKKQYAHVSIRTWILARSQYEKCNINLVHGLYFYSADCEECINQGEQLDILGKNINHQGFITSAENKPDIFKLLYICPQQCFDVVFRICCNLLEFIYGDYNLLFLFINELQKSL